MEFKQRDIVLIEVPFIEGTGQKKLRPVLFISNKHMDHVNEFIAIPLTTKKFSDGLKFFLGRELIAVPMRKKSYLKLNRICCLDKSKILRKVNEIHHIPFTKVTRRFNRLIKLIV